MGQTQSLGLTEGENKWRSHTELQRQRNTMLLVIKRSEKIEFIKWAKQFDADPLSYIRFTQGQYPIPENTVLKIMALGYVCDISEVKRLHNEEDVKVNWTPIPFGITKKEWDNPELVEETIMDRPEDEDSDPESDPDDPDDPPELGKNINLYEEVADESDPEPEPEPNPEPNPESEPKLEVEKED
jgi:hypothetical protein